VNSAAASEMQFRLVEPLVSFEPISRVEINDCLIAWDHKMGPLNRPNYGRARYHGVRHDGQLVAVAGTDQMIPAETCGLRRDQALELTRICAARPDLCRVALRLWREFVFPALSDAWETPWAISYSDNQLHEGDLYRFDGWLRVGNTRSGTDTRGDGEARKGRNKTVWAWCADDLARAIVRAEP
jgi:hypothetical protein